MGELTEGEVGVGLAQVTPLKMQEVRQMLLDEGHRDGVLSLKI